MRTFLQVILALAIAAVAGIAIGDIVYDARCDGNGYIDDDWGCIRTGYSQWDCLESQDWCDTNGCLITNQPNWRCETWYTMLTNVVTNCECRIETFGCAVIKEERGTVYLWNCGETYAP